MIKPLRRVFRLVLVLVCLSISPLGFASDWASDGQFWGLVTLQGPKDKRIKGYLEVQPRFNNDVSELDRILIRPAVGVQVKPNVSLWQGYAWVPAFLGGSPDEHRIFQQSIITHRHGLNTFTHRTRLEERFIENTSDTALRYRHMIRFTRPIKQSPTWQWAAYNEVFFHLNDTSATESGFDQNRLFVGVNKLIREGMRLEGGYMNNIINPRGARANQFNHVLVLFLSTEF